MRTIEGKESFPADLKSDFFAEEQVARKKLETLKTMIGETFPVSNLFDYSYICLLYTSPSPRDRG